jgi:FMN phosphatase YigB (HAD superfamily)
MNTKLLILDLDGTLYYQTPVRIFNFLKILLFLIFLPSTVTEIRILRRYRSLREIFSEQLKPIADVVDIISADVGMSPEEIRRIRDKWMVNKQANFIRMARRRWLLKKVKKLQKLGINIAILSDYPINHKISRLNLYPEYIVCSEQENVKYAKPHPNGILEVLKS